MNISKFLDELKGLRPDSQIQRLKELKNMVGPEEVESLRKAADEVGQPWLSNALIDIANKYRKQEPDIEIEPEDTSDMHLIRSEAISDAIGQFLHELEPIVGGIKYLAEKEVENFENSKIRVELGLLDEILHTFSDWRKVEKTPKFREFNIFNLIDKECQRIAEKSLIGMQISVAETLVFLTDRSLFRIILSNAIRNSVEAYSTESSKEEKPIVITGGIMPDSLWLTVIDRGHGLKSDTGTLLKSSFSTKPGNLGMGLAIIDKAVKSLGGKWELKNSNAGGAEFHLELPKGIS